MNWALVELAVALLVKENGHEKSGMSKDRESRALDWGEGAPLLSLTSAEAPSCPPSGPK